MRVPDLHINWHKMAIFMLKVAAVTVASPRYIGTFGVAAGLDIGTELEWLPLWEAYSGGAMALLEGFAVAYVLSRWRLLEPGSSQSRWLLGMWLALALAMPLTAAPYLLAAQRGIPINALFATEEAKQSLWQGPWAFLVAAVPILVVIAVGFADVDETERQLAKVARKSVVSQAKRQASQADGSAKPTECPHCGRGFASALARAGHEAHCKARGKAKGEQNGKVDEQEVSHA